jgi:hypothetical protein
MPKARRGKTARFTWRNGLCPLNRHSITHDSHLAGGLFDVGGRAMPKIQRAPCGGKSGKIGCQFLHSLHNIIHRLVHSFTVSMKNTDQCS